jgi:hypothetical protein
MPSQLSRRLKDKVGPRNMIHCWATDVDDPTEQPRWGKIGKQKVEDAGPLSPDVPAGKIENGIVSGLDWFPTFVAAAGDPEIADELKKAKSWAIAPTRSAWMAMTKRT